MEIQIRSRRKIPGLRNQKIRQNLQTVLRDLECHDGELSILFTGDRHISELNCLYLGRTGPTNVMAFPMSEGGPAGCTSGMLGDVVISVDTAVREARSVGGTLEGTIYRLLIHGILHLLNYDHERSVQEERRMGKEERRLLALMKEE
jgi:probable rRNA maturation factor